MENHAKHLLRLKMSITFESSIQKLILRTIDFLLYSFVSDFQCTLIKRMIVIRECEWFCAVQCVLLAWYKIEHGSGSSNLARIFEYSTPNDTLTYGSFSIPRQKKIVCVFGGVNFWSNSCSTGVKEFIKIRIFIIIW